ncbi:B-box zinc finger protein 22 [Canna indica]|uniref:B-box zinc finger protein 22 n=1 Tax=Canna indica TaxID=4628 RepID=A0AAQ3K5Y4_9LILI|nr:B-box zinc finger protein 22 [Canna indica]
MKIQCDVCERAEAAVLCCADEAALCWGCDQKVHAANKVAGKHQRVPLLPRTSDPSSPSLGIPSCDICQEKTGYFFCLEDRALLCRQCDVATHTASPYVSTHRRFLITGAKVALQNYLADDGNDKNNSSSNSKANSSSSNCCSSKNQVSSLASTDSDVNKGTAGDPIEFAVEHMERFTAEWSWNEFFDGVDLEQCYGQPEPGSSS